MDPTEKMPPTLSPEDGKRSSFWNILFLEYWIMDNDQKLCNPEYQERVTPYKNCILISKNLRYVFLSLFCSYPRSRKPRLTTGESVALTT
jgi:hypothetical protein